MEIESLRVFKQRLVSGAVFGLFSKTSDPALVEIAGYAGFDFIILDLEHGPNTTHNLQHLVRAAEIGGIVPIVRVKESPRSLIGEVLDVGAAGVQVPQITTAANAREAVAAAKFAPSGNRGVCRFVRAAEYSSMDKTVYFEQSNEALVVLQIEGREAIENLEEILTVPGIDVVFIGPYDLSQSLGRPGDVEHPEVVGAVNEIVKSCIHHKISVGTFVDSPATAKHWLAAGVRYLSYSVDLGIFSDACRKVLKDLRSGGHATPGSE